MTPMNSRQRTLAAVKGLPHDRIPVAQHNFPFVVRHCGLTIKEYMYNPDKAAQALADTAYDFGYDCIIIDFDTCVLAEAMGAVITVEENAPARIAISAANTVAEVKTLKMPNPCEDGRLPLWIETTRLLRKKVGGELAIMGRADQGPFGLLGLLYSPEQLMMDLLDESAEDDIFAGLELCVQTGAAFANAQLDAGADMTSIGDGLAGESLISPDMYMRFAQPFEKKYRKLLGDGLLSLHICGKSNNIIDGMAATGIEILELDHLNDLERSFQIVANRACIFGNIDPSSVLVQGDADCVKNHCKKAILDAKRHNARFVLCPGCLMMGNTPPENVRAMVESAAEFGQYF
jgi:MtaA/CmuA family methyltransferase